MERSTLEAFYLCGIAIMIVFQMDYYIKRKADWAILKRQKKKMRFLILMFFGLQLFPLYYLFSLGFDATDFQLPDWTGYPIMAGYLLSVWVFYSARLELGKLWTPGEEIKEDMVLVTSGVYQYVRHPMYASIIAVALLQPLMIRNFIIAVVALITILPFCLYQTRREERILTQYFGDEYRDYISSTGRFFPMKNRWPRLIHILIALVRKTPGAIVRLYRKVRYYR